MVVEAKLPKSSYSYNTLPKFMHFDTTSVDEAVSLLMKYKTAGVVAGFSILQLFMKCRVYKHEALVNLKTIPNMNYIKEEGGMLKIGALATLTEIERSSVVNSKYTALAQAARATASPRQRDVGTIGGNICQPTQCWLFKAPEIICLRKDLSAPCYAVAGDNRFHSIFGGIEGCFAVNPGDTAPAITALGAKIKTSKRTLDAKDFLKKTAAATTVLEQGEIVTEIQVPEPAAGTKSAYVKFAIRRAIDFPVVSCAAVIGGGKASIVLGAVYNNPYKATKAETAIAGKAIDEASAEAAGTAAVDGAVAMSGNRYKIHIAKTITKRAVLACA